VDWPLELSPEERRLGYDGIAERYLANAVRGTGKQTHQWPPSALAKWDSVTFPQFLAAQGASPAAVELLNLGFEDTHTSALW
jgi:monoamine oxidase